jgi:hypothetical protein
MSSTNRSRETPLLRLAPIVVLLLLTGAVYWFWPAKLEVIVYDDMDSSGTREANEPGAANERLTLVDANFSKTALVTNADGVAPSKTISPGPYSLSVRGFTIQGNANRGDNLLRLGFFSSEDATPPQTRIFLGDELGFHTQETSQRRIYVHLWYSDPETPIDKVEIDLGDGRGWQSVDLSQPTMQYHIYPYEYTEAGRKTVKVKATNAKGLSSFPTAEPPREGTDFQEIHIVSQLSEK